MYRLLTCSVHISMLHLSLGSTFIIPLGSMWCISSGQTFLLVIHLFSSMLLVYNVLLNAVLRNKVDFHILQSELETLCQRCAKSTRSNILYPLCCDNKDTTVKAYCERYLNFGIHGRDIIKEWRVIESTSYGYTKLLTFGIAPFAF
jgi:hypothetical protein